MFGLTYKHIWSIGYAVRSDTTWPADLTPYGSNEAERRFNFITQKSVKNSSHHEKTLLTLSLRTILGTRSSPAS